MGIRRGPNIVRDGLVFAVDAANPSSFVSGSTAWNDLTLNQNNGTLINGPAFSSANAGSIVFDGSDDYVSIPPTNFNAVLTNTITLETFINISNTSGYQLIGGGQDNTLYRYTAAFNWNQSGQSKLGFDLEAASGQVRLVSSSTYTSNNWLHLVGTYDGSTAKFYVNNILEDTDSGTSGNVNDFDGFILGRDINLSAGRVFNGKMACYKVYNRALSASEVLQNYNALKGRFGL
tara:strand:- start:204 stop:902 length:699 start_codon:yes stop_codon:yes gene_type:complete